MRGSDRISFTLTGSGEYVAPAALDDLAGEVSVSRVGADLGIRFQLSDTPPERRGAATTLTLGVSTTQSFYDFEGASGLLPGTDDPFDHVQEYGVSLLLMGPLGGARGADGPDAMPRWSYILGGSIDSAGAENADFSDTLTYGGIGGAAYTFNRRLTLGAALLVRTQLEDDPIIFPVPVVRWQLSEKWMLDTLGPRIELGYRAQEKWRFGAFVAFDGRSIRLGDDAAVIDAVLNERRIPIGGFVEFTPTNAFTLRASVAGHMFGELETFDASGNEIASSDVDPAVGLGLDVVFRF